VHAGPTGPVATRNANTSGQESWAGPMVRKGGLDSAGARLHSRRELGRQARHWRAEGLARRAQSPAPTFDFQVQM
jgi:hypothetical protein